MIEANIVADSISPTGFRLTTFHLKYPRFIHSEFMTHRAFSKNAASSRAIPASKFIDKVLQNPVIPINWGQNQKGMQVGEELDDAQKIIAKGHWLAARDDAVKHAKSLMACGLHKSLVNRILETWFWMETVTTATNWGNYFNLRVHKDAEHHIRELAKLMMLAYINNKPKNLNYEEWHLPFTDKHVPEGLDLEILKKVSVARCARVSYINFEHTDDISKDIELHDRLLSSRHLSPFEHVATPMNFYYLNPNNGYYSGNFKGWNQYRKSLPNENRDDFNAEELLKALE